MAASRIDTSGAVDDTGAYSQRCIHIDKHTLAKQALYNGFRFGPLKTTRTRVRKTPRRTAARTPGAAHAQKDRRPETGPPQS